MTSTSLRWNTAAAASGGLAPGSQSTLQEPPSMSHIVFAGGVQAPAHHEGCPPSKWQCNSEHNKVEQQNAAAAAAAAVSAARV